MLISSLLIMSARTSGTVVSDESAAAMSTPVKRTNPLEEKSRARSTTTVRSSEQHPPVMAKGSGGKYGANAVMSKGVSLTSEVATLRNGSMVDLSLRTDGERDTTSAVRFTSKGETGERSEKLPLISFTVVSSGCGDRLKWSMKIRVPA